jgi:DNA-binding transcriptional MerR regulator
VVCDLPRLHQITPELARDGKWKALMREAFQHAFDWLGFGAKTAVGYGAMETDENAQFEQEQAQQKAHEQAELEKSLKELPGDAAELERAKQAGAWKETNDFLQSVEEFLEGRDLVSPEAFDILTEAVRQRWPGILDNPEATTGKKKKPKYKPRPKQIALRILEIDKK